MIRDYRDHAANERTFLAWVRTGVAVIGFGFVVEKFNVFVLAVAGMSSRETDSQLRQGLLGQLGHYDGIAIIIAGLALLVIATARFIRIQSWLGDAETRSSGGARIEILFSLVLTLVVAAASAMLIVG